MRIQQMQNTNTNFQGKQIKKVLDKNKSHNSNAIKEICDYSEYYANLGYVKKFIEKVRHIKEDVCWDDFCDMMRTPFGLEALLFLTAPIAIALAFAIKGCSNMENNKEQIENRQNNDIQNKEQSQNTIVLEHCNCSNSIEVKSIGY